MQANGAISRARRDCSPARAVCPPARARRMWRPA